MHYKWYEQLTVHLGHYYFLFSAFMPYFQNSIKFKKGLLKNPIQSTVYICQ